MDIVWDIGGLLGHDGRRPADLYAAGSLAATAVVQSLLADDYGLIVPEWRQHVHA